MPGIETQNQENPAPTSVEAGSMSAAKSRPRKAKGAAAIKPASKPVEKPTKRAADTKTDIVLKKLRNAKGATIEQMAQATGWQAHSVRRFLSGTVKKKLELNLVSDTGKDGIRRYRIEREESAG